MKKRSSFVVQYCLAALVLVCAIPASAQDGNQEAGPRPFGNAGQWALSNDSALTVQRSSQADVKGSVVTVMLAPSFDYFVIRNLSLGGYVGLRYTKAGDSDGLRFDIGPRVGYNVYLADRWSLWPKVGVSYARTRSSIEMDTEGDATLVRKTTQNAIALNLFVPVIFHPVQHFFIGFGPFVDTDLNGDNRATVFGGKLTMGGWFGGT